MAMYIVLGMLAAYGLLCALWAVFGLCFSGARGWAAVCFCAPGQEAALRRCCRLRDWGLLRGCVLAVHKGLPQEQIQILSREFRNVEFCTLEALPARLELELEYFAGTGIGDHSGHHRGRGISEL